MTKRHHQDTEPGERGELRVVCPVCDSVLDTMLKPITESGITFKYATCQKCDDKDADLDVLATAESYVEMVDNPAHPWSTSTLAIALSAVVRGYKVLAAQTDIFDLPEFPHANS